MNHEAIWWNVRAIDFPSIIVYTVPSKNLVSWEFEIFFYKFPSWRYTMMIIVIYDHHHIIQNHRVICRGAGGSYFKKKNKVALKSDFRNRAKQLCHWGHCTRSVVMATVFNSFSLWCWPPLPLPTEDDHLTRIHLSRCWSVAAPQDVVSATKMSRCAATSR